MVSLLHVTTIALLLNYPTRRRKLAYYWDSLKYGKVGSYPVIVVLFRTCFSCTLENFYLRTERIGVYV
jgi:hypothetical protein